MKVCLVCAIAALLFAGFVVSPAWSGQEGDVIVGQELVLRIRFEAGGLSVKQRVDAVTVRINDLLGSRPFKPADVRVELRNKEWVVVVGNKLIITADARTAAINKCAPQQLATIWADNLRRVIPKAKSEIG